ncbi:MAG: hypothetical protein J6D79_02085 [Clostridia bacterium]|nr:hypothetical protein [Clostridia bacterium]
MDKSELFVFKSERCIMCGNEIPEGRQVCPKCEEAVFEGDAAAANDCGGTKKSQKAKRSLFRLFKTDNSHSKQ